MLKIQKTCSVIIVTYNSEKHLPKAVECLQKQTVAPKNIIIVDTGSSDRTYLDPYREMEEVTVTLAEPESGFCVGNNVGMGHVPKGTDYVLFLNPDAFLSPRFIERAIAFLENSDHKQYGAVTGTTLHYDIESDAPTGKVDTTGVFFHWYGHWYDRGQGEPYQPEKYQQPEEIPAICGAIFFCRMKALNTVRINGQEVFDSSFHMYKEDIDLSIRLRKQGWKLLFLPHLIAYHCRGWDPERKRMPRQMRLNSAWNEFRIHLREMAPVKWAYSSAKYAAIKLFDL